MSSPRSPRPRHVPRLEALEDRTTPAVHEWTGGGANNLWSNDANWTNNSPATDASGDIDLVFHTNLTNAAQLVTTNDITGLVVDSITFDANSGTNAAGGTSSSGYTINGNTITINTGSAGQNPFGIDVAAGVANATNGITETFNAGLTLLTTDATFRTLQNGSRLTFTGAIDLGTRTLTIDSAGINSSAIQSVVISGTISNGNLIKTSGGTLQLTGNNSYADTTVNNGVVLIDTSTALGATSGTVTVNDPAQILLRNGVTVVKTTLNLNSNQLGGGLGANGNTTNTWQGPVTLMAGAGGVALGAGVGPANAGTRLIIDGVISGATSTLALNGAGVIEFTQNNTYTGLTNHNGNNGFGALQIDTPGGLGAGGSGNEAQFNRNGLGPTGSALWLNFSGTLQDAGNVAENIFFAGNGVNNTGAIRLLGNNTVTIPGGIVFIAGAPWTFGVDNAAATLTTTGVIDDQGTSRALTKVGVGTLTIGGTAANTYSGGTVVNAGVLNVTNTSATPLGDNPAGAAPNLVTVNNGGTLQAQTGVSIANLVQLNAGGTLAGTGAVGPVISIGGTISPGFSTAILNTRDFILQPASTLRAEINGTTAGTTFDQVNVSGAVSLGGATLNVLLGFIPTAGQTFVIINNDGTDPVTGTFTGLPQGSTLVVNGQAFSISYTGGSNNNDVALTATGPAPQTPPTAGQRFAVGTGVGGQVRAYDAAGNQVLDFVPFSGFAGAVRVATGDVDGDGVEDVVVGATAPNGHVKVFSGTTGAEIRSFFAFLGFNGDVAVGAGDVNHDGFADILVGATAPNGHVKAFDGKTGALLQSFFAFPGFNGAVTVAGGDTNHDGFADIVVGASAPNGHVKVFDGASGALVQSFFAFPGFNGGVNVGAGDTNGDGFAEVMAGASTAVPHVKVFDGASGALIQSFFALSGFPGGVAVAGGDRNADGRADIVAGVGSLVRFFDGPTNALIAEFFPFGTGFSGGIFVG